MKLPKQMHLPPRHSTHKHTTKKKTVGRKMLMDGYKVMVIQEKDGSYSGKSVDFPGAISQGDTLAELSRNMKEAIELIRESYREEAEQIVRNPKVKGKIITIRA